MLKILRETFRKILEKGAVNLRKFADRKKKVILTELKKLREVYTGKEFLSKSEMNFMRIVEGFRGNNCEENLRIF